MNSVSQNFENIYSVNAAYVEDMFARFQSNPASVPAEWRAYFNGFFDGAKIGTGCAEGVHDIAFEMSVVKLVQNYKTCGHFHANINPLADMNGVLKKRVVSCKSDAISDIFNIASYGFGETDLNRITHAGMLVGLPTPLKLSDLIGQLERLFCGTVGIEIEHVACNDEKSWLYNEFLTLQSQPVPPQTQKQIYTELARADALEKTIATKYIGKKRFSIEGADAQIVAAESYMDALAALGTQEFRIGIAHRGRLNFLVNLVGKPLSELFAEFEGEPDSNYRGDGDVKYHNGYESIRTTRQGHSVRVGLSCNPSHLEYVDPVVMGESRAIQAMYYDSDTSKMAVLLFHGDAAVSGQGIVYETAQLMSLSGYTVGGVVHVVANNQIGFTTNPRDSRSSIYCTSVAHVTDSPVFHVNGDDPEAVHRTLTLAAKYHAQFKKDIYIDLLCFRRFGHNEGDEPSFTQPVLYKIIKEKPAPYEVYAKRLAEQNFLTDVELKKIHQAFHAEMNVVYDKMKAEKLKVTQFKPQREAAKLSCGSEAEILHSVDTSLAVDQLKTFASKLVEYPKTFHIHPKIEQLVITARKNMLDGKRPVDWGMAEMMAYASIIGEGFSLRLTGEDAQRGTFSHRHAVFIDTETEEEYSPLKIINRKPKVEIVNTLLSEEATMGYEYGYSVVAANTLTIWEGQFGDFANGAQVVIDQFIVSGETKWHQQQGLVLLLPHGMEGQGAEHSSARLERFLQLCAQGNMQVCYLTHANQIFHALRRQVKRNFRKPLVIMSPKGFLRSPRTFTTLESLAQSRFEEIFDDARITKPEAVERVLFCTGKIALDLFDALETEEFNALTHTVAVIRIEQLYPLHTEKLKKIISRYTKAQIFAWTQEEPCNMGAYQYIYQDIAQVIHEIYDSSKQFLYFGRSRRATPAVGFEKVHQKEQATLIASALKSRKSEHI